MIGLRMLSLVGMALCLPGCATTLTALNLGGDDLPPYEASPKDYKLARTVEQQADIAAPHEAELSVRTSSATSLNWQARYQPRCLESKVYEDVYRVHPYAQRIWFTSAYSWAAVLAFGGYSYYQAANGNSEFLGLRRRDAPTIGKFLAGTAVVASADLAVAAGAMMVLRRPRVERVGASTTVDCGDTRPVPIGTDSSFVMTNTVVPVTGILSRSSSGRYSLRATDVGLGAFALGTTEGLGVQQPAGLDLKIKFSMTNPAGEFVSDYQIPLAGLDEIVIAGQCKALKDYPEAILSSTDLLGPYGFSRRYDALLTECPEVTTNARELFCKTGFQSLMSSGGGTLENIGDAAGWAKEREHLQRWVETCPEEFSIRGIPLIKSAFESSMDLSTPKGLKGADELMGAWSDLLDDEWVASMTTRRDALERTLTNEALEEALADEYIRIAKKIIEDKADLMGEGWVTSSHSRVASLERKVERRRAAEQAAREADPAYREARYFECADRVKREQGCYADDTHDPRWHPGCVDALIVAMDRCKHWE